MSVLEKILHSPEETAKLAHQVARFLLAGDVILLKGSLGAGKSFFARSLIRALGCRQQHIQSPSFTLMNTYDDTRLPLAHVDLFRINTVEEMADLALEPFFKHGVVVIEWPEKVPMDSFPETALHISVDDRGGEDRLFTLEGKSWEKRLGFIDESLRRPSTEKGRANFLTEITGRKGDVISPVSADASFRSYWRVRLPEGNRIIMDAPPPLEEIDRFVEVDRHLARIGVHVPHIYQVDSQKGYALLEDLGDTTFYDAIQKGANVQQLYERAVDVLIHIAKSDRAPVANYSLEMVQNEACVFTDWYMPIANREATHTADRRIYRALWEPLWEKIQKTPKTTILADYHCQNLMLLGPLDDERDINNVGVIDFQDARIGTVVYDMVSLLYDVRYDVPKALHELLIKRFVDGLEGAVTMEDFMVAFRLMGTQNLLRIAGVFTRLWKRDGKQNYQNYMPRLWRHLDEFLSYRETETIRTFLEKHTPVARELSA